MKGLKKWTWGELKPYNGFTGTERVRGWQLVHFLADNGWATNGATCCISGQTDRIQLHLESYYHWGAYSISRSLHLALHRRFRQPDAWQRVVDQYASTGEEWYSRLSMVPVDLAGELRASCGPEITDIFARAPIPEGVVVPLHQLYRYGIE